MSSFLSSFWKRKGKEGKEEQLSELKKKSMPRHIAIIMDGNGRWATKRGLPRSAGHRAGVESLKRTVELCGELGIDYLTVYAFSTENWKRPKEEVDTLMNLLMEYVDKELARLHTNGVCIKAIGRIEELPTLAQAHILKAIEKTKNNKKLVLQIALNYGGRRELVDAFLKMGQDLLEQNLDLNEINEQLINQYLYTKDVPDPDLMIRPSGEMRISNFLLWQLAYTEFWVTDVLWPDFREEHLYQALHDYQNRQRRFGGL